MMRDKGKENSRQSSVDSRQWTVDSRQWTVDSRQWTVFRVRCLGNLIVRTAFCQFHQCIHKSD